MNWIEIVVGAALGALVCFGISTVSRVDDERVACIAKGGAPVVTYGPGATSSGAAHALPHVGAHPQYKSAATTVRPG